MNHCELKQNIIDSLKNFNNSSFEKAAIHFFKVLGYESMRTLPIHSFNDMQNTLDPNNFLNEKNAFLSRWKEIHLLFQLTGEEINGSKEQLELYTPTFQSKEIKSYLFFAIEMKGEALTRSQLSMITRSMNKLVLMPVLILFKHNDSISLAIINRRKNLRDASRDVLTRVSLIRNIQASDPHRAHIDLLCRFSLSGLEEEACKSIKSFADLDNAWQRILSTQELNKRFYRDLANWFKWASDEIKLPQLPDHTLDIPLNRNRAIKEFAVRLICRLLFAWFLKEKKLIPPQLLELFDITDQRRMPVRDVDDNNFMDGNHYYRGILQNIFFKALNNPMDQRRKSREAAKNDFSVAKSALRKMDYLGKNYLPDDFDYDLFDCIPYLNGGLFDALPEDNALDTIEDKTIRVPNKLFCATKENEYYVPSQRGNRRIFVEGLNWIFDYYCFTVAENTPLEEDVALDPELLGLVFENLLAEIDPSDESAADNARKASGSYYTPRRIVDYMVNEALYLHLRTRFEKTGASKDDLFRLNQLFYRPEGGDFASITERVVAELDQVRVLDPACGSGAFPMGMLHRMVDVLHIVDPENALWKQRLLDRLPSDMRKDAAKGMSGKSYNYLRKLGLVKNNLYGLDIQPLAALIAKLRFFLTLVIEQDAHPSERDHNYGIQPLPNIETNIICCNSLVDGKHDVGTEAAVAFLRQAREEYFQPQTSIERREELTREISKKLASMFPGFAEEVKGIRPANHRQRLEQDAFWFAEWFRHATVHAPFFDVETFFPELSSSSPFHIVIGNPPYGGDKISKELKKHLELGWRDPYGAFISRFMGSASRISPLANDGVLSFIVSDTFMTIKSHRPLREIILNNRIHKMIRVSGDTFRAVVNCAVIICQRGAAPLEHTCLMADLANVSIWEQYERFLDLLNQTEGFARRQNVANQTYAIYHYRQKLIETNSNKPFFVASPKLFALMQDIGNKIRVNEKNLPTIAYNGSLNGHNLRLFKLGDQYTGMGISRRWLNQGLFQVISGIKTGSNSKYLRLLSNDAQKNFQTVDISCFLDDNEAIELSDDQKMNGITGKRCFIRFEMGMPADTDSGLLPCYFQSLSSIVINWSRKAVNSMRLEVHSDLANSEYRFRPFNEQISFSFAGQYCPTFRLANAPIFLNAAPRIFLRPGFCINEWLGVFNSKIFRYITREYINHSVNFGVDDIKEFPALVDWKIISKLAANILENQERKPNYDYPSNEQLEIDKLVYSAYELNDSDIREVENWYARRYPKLAAAQRKTLAAKQGKTEEQLIERPLLHLYCDESRHLPYDHESNFLLGLVSCPAGFVRTSHQQLSALWQKHKMPPDFEAKWTKVSPGKKDFYLALLDWFFRADGIVFCAHILPEKERLYASLPDDSRDNLYYRFYYQLLRGAIEPESQYRIFLDIKDTRGREKVKQLTDILRRDADDPAGKAVKDIQHVHSHEIKLMQITDLLLGAVGFARRPKAEKENSAKRAFINLLEERLGHPLTSDTIPGSDKVTLLTWYDEGELLK